MSIPLKGFLRLALGMLAMLCGCASMETKSLYGVEPPPHDPTVVMTDFSYTPAGPVHYDTKITLTAKLNKPQSSMAGYIAAYTGDIEADPLSNAVRHLTTLNDSGLMPDETAMDGVWTGDCYWPASISPGSGLPVFARFAWFDGFYSEATSAPGLTLLPDEEK